MAGRQEYKTSMKKIKTAIEFTKNITTVGAFKESSTKVEEEICSKLNDGEDVVVVEFGMGHGNITQKILDKISPKSKLYSFEINEKFCTHVAEKIEDDRLKIVHDSAEHVKRYLTSHVDYIIGSIPFSFIPKSVANKIVMDSYDLLKQSAYFSQYLYVPFHGKRFKRIFDAYELVKIKNLPVEYVYHFEKY